MFRAAPSVGEIRLHRIVPVKGTAESLNTEPDVGRYPAAESDSVGKSHLVTAYIVTRSLGVASLNKRLVDTRFDLDEPVVTPIGKVTCGVVASKFSYSGSFIYENILCVCGRAVSGSACNERHSVVKISCFHKILI